MYIHSHKFQVQDSLRLFDRKCYLLLQFNVKVRTHPMIIMVSSNSLRYISCNKNLIEFSKIILSVTHSTSNKIKHGGSGTIRIAIHNRYPEVNHVLESSIFCTHVRHVRQSFLLELPELLRMYVCLYSVSVT